VAEKYTTCERHHGREALSLPVPSSFPARGGLGSSECPCEGEQGPHAPPLLAAFPHVFCFPFPCWECFWLLEVSLPVTRKDTLMAKVAG